MIRKLDMLKQQMNDLILLKLQEKLQEKVTIQDNLEKVFTNWFQGLLKAAQASQMQEEPAGEEIAT